MSGARRATGGLGPGQTREYRVATEARFGARVHGPQGPSNLHHRPEGWKKLSSRSHSVVMSGPRMQSECRECMCVCVCVCECECIRAALFCDSEHPGVGCAGGSRGAVTAPRTTRRDPLAVCLFLHSVATARPGLGPVTAPRTTRRDSSGFVCSALSRNSPGLVLFQA